jgi:hypothetical protein
MCRLTKPEDRKYGRGNKGDGETGDKGDGGDFVYLQLQCRSNEQKRKSAGGYEWWNR